jgi:NTE family protein
MLRHLEEPIGFALGSGAARGWAHVGAIRALQEAGIEPRILCGSSSGAVVGAIHAAGKLDSFEEWGRQLNRRQVMGYFDFSLRGGLIRARKLLEFVTAEIGNVPMQSLGRRFAAVATDLATGQEVWLREEPLIDALQASMALPGLVTPVHLGGRWLVDGGLVNPTPVSLCRALGAASVVAVDLNTSLLSKRFESAPTEGSPPGAPGIYDVITQTLEIMQVRITRSRMAGDPPELLIAPRLADFALLDFARAPEAIEEGRRAVARALASASEAK